MRDYLLTIVEGVGFFHCIFIAIALFYLPGNHRHATRLLGLLQVIFAFVFAHAVLRQNDLLFLAPIVSFIRLPFMFLYGPLLFIYLQRITAPAGHTARREYLHFLPFICVMLVYLPAFTLDHIQLLHLTYYADLVRLYPATRQLNFWQEWIWLISTRFLMFAFVLHLGLYMVLSLRLLAAHKRRVLQHFSHIEKVSLDWMRNLLLTLVGIWLLVAARNTLFAGTVTGIRIGDSLELVQLLFLSALGLFGLLQKSVFNSPSLPSSTETASAGPGPVEKYQNSSLTEQQQADSLKVLLEVMQQQKPFLDSELTITDLAALSGISARHISQIINSRLDQNFLEFVNSYRIDEAKRHLEDPGWRLSILTIAMEAGFNSKSAFYAAFKRNVGETPTAYRQRQGVRHGTDAQT